MSEASLLDGMMQEEQVVEYLLRHPAFFLKHQALLDQMQIPHPVKGAVSLLALQQERQRERINELQQAQQAMVEAASRNERIFRVYVDVYPELFACTTVRQLWKRLHHTFRDRLHIPASALWLNDGLLKARRTDQGFVLPTDRFKQLCARPLGHQPVFFGRLSDPDRQTLFGDQALVHSAAILRLGERGELGLLAFGHANPQHYHPGMDSLLLEQLGRFISLLLPSLVSPRD